MLRPWPLVVPQTQPREGCLTPTATSAGCCWSHTEQGPGNPWAPSGHRWDQLREGEIPHCALRRVISAEGAGPWSYPVALPLAERPGCPVTRGDPRDTQEGAMVTLFLLHTFPGFKREMMEL